MMYAILLSMALCGQADSRPLAPRAGEWWHLPPHLQAVGRQLVAGYDGLPAGSEAATPSAAVVIVIRVEPTPARPATVPPEDTDPFDDRPVIPAPKPAPPVAPPPLPQTGTVRLVLPPGWKLQPMGPPGPDGVQRFRMVREEDDRPVIPTPKVSRR